MTKRIIALTLCLFTLVAVFASCAGSIDPTAEYKGEQVTMYLSENIYDLDPARAYKNESTKSIVSMLFGTLFVLDENGKVQPSLAASYSTEEKDGEYFMYITMADTCWSDNTPISADDVVFAWKRLLNPNNSFEAAALLYDIKNAKAYSQNEAGKDEVGITADKKRLTIQFEGKIDYDHFLLNLTSLALAPLREDVVAGTKGADWAKKPGTMVCSGPFKLARVAFSKSKNVFYNDTDYDTKIEYKYEDGTKELVYIEGDEVKAFRAQYINSFVLERNSYYFRNADKDEMLDVSVTPYRILVDCAMSDEDIKEAYESGTILYVGDIPMSLRETYKDSAIVKDSLSTTTVYMNQNVELFANKTVRQALSMVINRDAIAEKLVFAEAATGIVPTGVFNTGSKSELFRDNSSNDFAYLKTDVAAAKQLLADAGIDATQYSFSFTYAAYDEVHTFVAEEIAKAWAELGFTVTLNPRSTIANNDYYKFTDSIPDDICDDLYAEDLASGNFEVILLDLVAPSADPFSVLAPFAKDYSGQVMDMSSDDYKATPHITGYDSEAYNAEIDKAFYEKTIANRSEALHAAEAILMDDMPAIPVVFNKSACLINDGLNLNNTTLWWENGSNYYVQDTLAWITVDNYDAYLVTCSNFLESKFDTYKTNTDSYFNSYEKFTWEEFKSENSNYAYLWKVYDITEK